MKKIPLILPILLSLAACQQHVSKPGDVPVPNTWKSAAAVSSNIQREWWLALSDPILNQLMLQAEQNNLDLKIAETRVRAARAQLVATRASFLPDLDASASLQRGKPSKQALPGSNVGGTRNLFDLGLDATWEFNLFGIGPAIQVAGATLAAETNNVNTVMLSLRGEVAHTYINLRYYQNLLGITQALINAYQTSLDIARAREQAGLVSQLDTIETLAQLQSQQADLPIITAQVSATIRSLEKLLGENPVALDSLLAPVASIPMAQTNIVAATPIAVMASRPDIRSAENKLVASNATIRVATAQYFPSISLPAAFGWQAQRAGDLFSSGSNIWSLAGAIKLPIFDFGRIESDIALARANADADFYNYKQTVQGALSDVETALADYFALSNRLLRIQSNVQARNQALQLTEKRFQSGLVSYADVAASQKLYYSEQKSYLLVLSELARAYVTLQKSMGGGMEGEGAKYPPVAHPAQALPQQKEPLSEAIQSPNVLPAMDQRPNAPVVKTMPQADGEGTIVIE